jgi:ribosomal protein S27AE
MTSQTQTFIELSDILSVRVECGKCQSTVTIPITREMNLGGMRRCSNCGNAWLAVEMTSIEEQVKDCAATIRATVDELRNWHKTLATMGSKGFSLTLEIQPEPPEES